MANSILKMRQLPRRGGFDITVRIENKAKGIDKIETFFWPGKVAPKLSDLESHLSHMESNIEDELTEKKPELLTREEVNELLVEKKYLTSGQDLDDLPVKQAEAVGR